MDVDTRKHEGRHQEVPSRLLSYAISRLGTTAALNQDRTAIYHNGLPSWKSNTKRLFGSQKLVNPSN